jgi:hypothetical protein
MNGTLLRWLRIQCVLCLFACLVLGILLFQYSQNLAIKTRSDWDRQSTNAIAAKIDEMRKIVPSGQTQNAASESSLDRIRSGLSESNINEARLGDVRMIGRTAIPKTTFAREDTAVSLKGVVLGELFSFIRTQEAQLGILVSGIELRTSAQPTDDTSKDRWDAELTLTQLIEQVPKKP